MSEQTVQVLGRIVVAEAEHQDIETGDLQVRVVDRAFCLAPAGVPDDEAHAWSDRWIAPPESHENFPQHRWDELVSMYAAKHCGQCPVQLACLALALREPHNYSLLIRGGLTPAQRNLTLEDAIETAGEGR
jgi:hypothetical protein